VSDIVGSTYFSPKQENNLLLNAEDIEEEGKVFDDGAVKELGSNSPSHLEHSIELLSDSENGVTVTGDGMKEATSTEKASDPLPSTEPNMITQYSDLDL